MSFNESAQQGAVLSSQVLNTADPGTVFVNVGKAFSVRRSKQLAADLIIEVASGTTPTLDVKLQESPDGVNFLDVTNGAFVQQTTTGHVRLVFPNDDGTGEVFGPICRFQAKVGGTTPSFTVTLIVTGKGVS